MLTLGTLCFLSIDSEYAPILLRSKVADVCRLLLIIEVRVRCHECLSVMHGQVLHAVSRDMYPTSFIFSFCKTIVGDTDLLHSTRSAIEQAAQP